MAIPIEERNRKYLEDLQGNIGKYLSYLSTMARFHKYEVADLTSFAIEAPAMFTAVASKEFWAKHFHRKINGNAKGVTLIRNGKETVYYDVSETQSIDRNPIEVKLWQYSDTAHKKFIDVIVEGESSTEKQIKIISEELANHSDIEEKSKKLLALSIEAVILERMGLSTENATRQLARISFKEHDVPKILEGTQSKARIFLDAMQRAVNQQEAEDLTVADNNPLLKEFGILKAAEKDKIVSEPPLNLKEEPVQLGLFDIPKLEPTKNKTSEHVDTVEELVKEDTSTAEVVDAEIIDKNSLRETPPNEQDDFTDETNTAKDNQPENQDDSAKELVGEDTSTAEVVDAEIIDGNSLHETPPVEQNDSADEMDEEEEILPTTNENQRETEILSDENSQNENISSEIDSALINEQIQTIEENFDAETITEPNEDIKPDLETLLKEDMAVIRGNSFEKNIFRKNVIAIRTLQHIEHEKRAATPEEIEVLKGYSGFGGIPKAFDKNDPNWNREAWLLQSMLTEKEYNAARASTLNAHYTPSEIIQGIYSGLENLGFNQGTILEPSMGVGGFFGNMPDEMKNGSHLYGVELDSLTGRIAKAIYPDAEINIQGFEDTRYLNNSFDLAVGNVPFGDYHVNDKGYNEHYFLIHDYFIAKMIDQVRPNGLVAVITSKGTLDKQDSRARKYFARRADLVRAIRLPNNAFKAAGTEVTSDILFFRKLDKIRDDDNLPNWVNVHSFNGERDITINNYFVEHPQDVLGRLEKTSTAYGFDLTCKSDETRPLNETLHNAMQSMPRIYLPNATALPLPQQIADIDDKRSSSYFIENGEVKFYDGVKVESIKVNAKDRKQMLLAMNMRDAVRDVISIQMENGSDTDLTTAQKRLNDIYDRYVMTYGHICEDSSLKKLFGNDSAYPLLRSLEEYGKEGYKGKSPIFSKRMIEPHRQPNHADSSADALAISMQEFGRVELGYMEHLTGQSEEKIISELEYDRIFFDFQKKEYQLAEEYLSGDVRAKMEATQFEIQRVDSEMDRKIASTVLDIEDYQHYEPKNEVERKIMECNPTSDSYFAFTDSQEKYIESQQDNRAFMVQVAMRHGIYASDKVSEILSDKPLIALETMRLCKRIGYSKPVNILILGCLRNIDEYFHRDNSEHDLMLYNFLKRHLAQYEGNLQAIKEQADNYGRHSDIGNIKEEWEQYQIDYQQRKKAKKKS